MFHQPTANRFSTARKKPVGGPIFELSFKTFAFLTYFMNNYAIVEISTKNKKKFVTLDRQICGFEVTKLIVLLIFNNDVKAILYWTYEPSLNRVKDELVQQVSPSLTTKGGAFVH